MESSLEAEESSLNNLNPVSGNAEEAENKDIDESS